MKSVERFTALLECATEEEWLKSIIQLGTDHGFEKTLIGVTFNRPTSLGDAFVRSNFEPRWLDIYDEKRLIQIDPTVAHSLIRSTPLVWRLGMFVSQKQKEMREEACQYGLRSGITFPFHGARGEKGLLSFANDATPGKSFSRDLRHQLPSLSMMRDFVCESCRRFVEPPDNPPPPTLTQRELECLKWCAEGKTAWEVAQILGCSESTVNFHFGNLRRKFQAISRRQVVVKAIQCGLLHGQQKWPSSYRESDRF